MSSSAPARHIVATAVVNGVRIQIYEEADPGTPPGGTFMLNDFTGADKVYIAYGYTDLRRGIDGLAPLVQQQFGVLS